LNQSGRDSLTDRRVRSVTWTQLTHLAEVLLPPPDGVAVDPDLQLRSVHWLLLVLQTQAPQVPVPAISRPTQAVAPERMPGAEVVSLDVIAADDSQWHVINPPAPGHDKRGGASAFASSSTPRQPTQSTVSYHLIETPLLSPFASYTMIPIILSRFHVEDRSARSYQSAVTR